jgi:hypothetical protein
MVARRLLFVLLALLVVSSIAAALVPVDSGNDPEATETTPPARQPAAEPPGRTVERTVDAGRRRPQTVRVDAGDRLVLSVEAGRFAEVEIAALGELEEVDAATPAVFDVVLPDAGIYPVQLLASGRRIATIAVHEANAGG